MRVFELPSIGEDAFYERPPAGVIAYLKKKFIFVNQRTDEWKKLLKFYRCGSNGGGIGEGFQGIYNLIRGNIIESLAIETLDTEFLGETDVTKFSLGFVVEERGTEGSPGASPDLMLLITRGKSIEIIPVEIKSLKRGVHNSDYYRGLHLAKKQIKGVKTLLESAGHHHLVTVNRGLIIIAHIEDRKLHVERSLVPIY